MLSVTGEMLLTAKGATLVSRLKVKFAREGGLWVRSDAPGLRAAQPALQSL